MNFVRLGQMISHECEWQLRDLAPYMGALLGFNSAADDRNPLRAEIVGAALHKGIEAISGERESRRILARDIGHAVAHVMPECYNEILRLLQERGVRPVHLTVRTVEGPGNQLGGRQFRLCQPAARRPRLVARRRLRRDRVGVGPGKRHGPARRAPARAGDGIPRPTRDDGQHPRSAALAARRQCRASSRQRRRRPAADDLAAPADGDRQPAGRARPGEPARAGQRAARRPACRARAPTPPRARPAAASAAPTQRPDLLAQRPGRRFLARRADDRRRPQRRRLGRRRDERRGVAPGMGGAASTTTA